MPPPAKSADTSAPLRCSGCERPLDTPLFCANCRTLHSADGYDYFQLLGLAPAYDLDADALRRMYLRLSREIHPDRYSAADPARAHTAMRLAARLNEAYQTLADPLARAEHLLEVHGGRSAVEDKTVPAEVLSATLLLREEFEDARSTGDSAALAALREQVEQRFGEVKTRIAELARRLPGTPAERTSLRAVLNTVRYYRRLLEQFDVQA